jgi:hypothetical protein
MRLTRRGAWVVTTLFALLFVAVSYIESVGTMP